MRAVSDTSDPAGALDFTGRSVIVTGGTRGLGRVICRTFLDAGADVVTCARNAPDRPVTSTDGMTADSFPFDHEFLTLCAGRIINEVRGINRVVYDVTSKPPGTIEWE